MLALLALALTVHASRSDWIPDRPVDEGPGLGGGDDWDARLHSAQLGELAVRRGRVLHWDPYSGFGAPGAANPEGLMLHPAWVIGVGAGTWVTGLLALYWTSLMLLFGGCMALARRLALPAVVGVLGPLFLLVSWEWTARLVSGHLFIFGMATWPAAIACAHRALEGVGSRRTRLLWGAAAGALLGTALLGGSHYGMPMGLLLVCLVLWGAEGPRRPPVVLAALLCVPLLSRDGPEVGQRLLEAALLGVLVWGMTDRPRERVEAALGVALGMIASAGALTAIGLAAVSTQGRLAWGTAGSMEDLLEGPQLWDAAARLEAVVWLPEASSWALVGLGIVGLFVRRPVIGLVTLAGGAAAFTQGAAWKPWAFWSGLPGSGAVGAHGRWSWTLLLFAVIGIPALAAALAERGGDRPNVRRGAVAAVASAALSALWFHVDLPAKPLPTTADPTPLGPDDGGIRGIEIAGDSPLSRAVHHGVLRARREAFEYGRMYPPERADGRLVWGLADGCPAPAPPDVLVQPDVESWTVTGPPGFLVVLAQRAVSGWRCEGGEIVDGWAELAPECREEVSTVLSGAATRAPGDPLAVPPPEQQWLTIQLGESGRTRCSWTSPGWGAGLAAQGAAVLLIVLLLGAEIRSRRASAPAPPGETGGAG